MEAIGFERLDGIVWRGLTTSLCSWVRGETQRWPGLIESHRGSIGWETLLVCQRPDSSVKVGSLVLQEQSIGECSCTLP